MAVPVIESDWTSNRENDSGKVTLTKPAGVAVDELLLILVANGNETTTAQWDNSTLKPAGFELIQEGGSNIADQHFAAFWRIADGTEASTVDAFCEDGGAEVHGYYLRCTGADTVSPIHVIGSVLDHENIAAHDIPALTTTKDDCLILFLFAHDGGDALPFSVGGGWTLRAELDTGFPTEQCNSCWGHKPLPTAGSSGVADVTDGGTDHDAGGFQFAIAPPDAGGPTPGEFLRRYEHKPAPNTLLRM